MRFKNRGLPCHFPSFRGQKIKNTTKIEQKRLLFFALFSFLYSISCTKTELHNKYDLTLCLAHFLTNLPIKLHYFRRLCGGSNVQVFKNRNSSKSDQLSC